MKKYIPTPLLHTRLHAGARRWSEQWHDAHPSSQLLTALLLRLLLHIQNVYGRNWREITRSQGRSDTGVCSHARWFRASRILNLLSYPVSTVTCWALFLCVFGDLRDYIRYVAWWSRRANVVNWVWTLSFSNLSTSVIAHQSRACKWSICFHSAPTSQSELCRHTRGCKHHSRLWLWSIVTAEGDWFLVICRELEEFAGLYKNHEKKNNNEFLLSCTPLPT